jgi:hypothetical protein
MQPTTVTRRHRARYLLAILGSTVLALLPPTAVRADDGAAAPAGTGTGVSGSMDPETLATMRKQEALQPALQAIWDEQRQNPTSGFAGVAFEVDGLTLYWKGGLTPGMETALARRAASVP